MIDRLDRLHVLLRLRRRDVDRRGREVARASAALDAAALTCDAAGTACDTARATHRRSEAQRLSAPADAFIAVFCRAAEAQVGEAEERRDQAEIALAETRRQADSARRRWLRAQARLDALDEVYRKAVAARERARESRACDEAVEQARPAFGLALA